MLLQESEKIELKRIVIDDIKKEIIAFANSGGGTLYIGRKMIRETDGEQYEKSRSTEQELTFACAEAEFSKRGIPFASAHMVTLGLTKPDGVHTNLGALLSDQCSHTIKVAVFQDATQQTFKDRREFGGSLFKHINDVYSFLDLHNKTESRFDKLLRIDKRDYPEIALREALLNAVIHREYAVSASILIKIFANRTEFISPGGLVSGIEQDDIMTGCSICRNTALASVFYRLQLIEAYGTGILKIFEAYKGFFREPCIEITPNVFKIILPNMNVKPETTLENPTPQERVLLYIREHGSISRKQTETLLGISQTAAGVILRNMLEKGDLYREGDSRTIRYFAHNP